MRVGIDARYAFRQNRRGIGEYVAALVRHLPDYADASDEFYLYVDALADLGAISLARQPFIIRRLTVSNPLLWEEVFLPMAAATDGLDLLHLTANYGPTFSPCPTVYTIHDLIEFIRPTLGPMHLPFRHAVGRAVRIRTLPLQARKAQRVITISEASHGDLVRILHLDPERVCVIPQGVSTDFHPPANTTEVRHALRRAGYAVPERYALALGALDPRKNGLFLMRSFARIHHEFPDVQLWIVGVERPAEYPLPFAGCPPWLKVVGFVGRDVLLKLFQGATTFVYPSLYEGFGLPVLEALACGLPVASSDRTSMPEVLGQAGVLFDPSVEDDLARSLRKLLSDGPFAHACKQAARVQAAAFSWPATVSKTVEVYQLAAREVR